MKAPNSHLIALITSTCKIVQMNYSITILKYMEIDTLIFQEYHLESQIIIFFYEKTVISLAGGP